MTTPTPETPASDYTEAQRHIDEVQRDWQRWTPETPAGELDDPLVGYDPAPGLVARGVMAGPDDHDPESCEAGCCQSAGGPEACPPALRCPDRAMCPLSCQEAGSREDPNHRPERHPADRTRGAWLRDHADSLTATEDGDRP